MNVPVNIEIGFIIKPSTATVDGWSNILHFTTGKNCCGYGSRVPAVWFSPKSHTLVVSSGHGKNGNYYNWECNKNLLTLSPNQDYRVKLVLQEKHINVYVNDQQACSNIPRGDVKPLRNVQVYLSDPWYPAAKATVKDFYLKEQVAPPQGIVALSFIFTCFTLTNAHDQYPRTHAQHMHDNVNFFTSLSVSLSTFIFLFSETCGGTAKGARCVFPFVYQGQKYNSCTTVNYNGKRWCSTESVYKGKWGSCDCGGGE